MVWIFNFLVVGSSVVHSLGNFDFRPLAKCTFHSLGKSTCHALMKSTYHFQVSTELKLVDKTYSETTLVRPALERLCDLVAAGCVDRLYVQYPDRMARKYA